MIIGKAELGQLYSMYVKDDINSGTGGFSQIGTKKTVDATVIAIGCEGAGGIGGIMMGWKDPVPSHGPVFLIGLYLKGVIYVGHMKSGMKTIRDFDTYISAAWAVTHYEIKGGPYDSKGNPWTRECPCRIYRGDCDYHRS